MERNCGKHRIRPSVVALKEVASGLKHGGKRVEILPRVTARRKGCHSMSSRLSEGMFVGKDRSPNRHAAACTTASTSSSNVGVGMIPGDEAGAGRMLGDQSLQPFSDFPRPFTGPAWRAGWAVNGHGMHRHFNPPRRRFPGCGSLGASLFDPILRAGRLTVRW
jgi:hypothetical protein